MQGAWAWFDDLSNLQATGFLLALLVSMLAVATCLLGATIVLVPTSTAPVAARGQSASAAPERTAPAQAERSEPFLPRAAGLWPSQSESLSGGSATLLSTVNLRAEPTTASQSLVVLSAHTDLVLLGDTAQTGNALWEHVRTEDALEGWIIATALD